MKHLFFLFVVFWSCTFVGQSLWAQKVDFDQIVQPVDQIAPEFEEFLVQLAWVNNPSNEVLQERIKLAETELRTAKLGWFETFGVNMGYNPSSGQPQINENDDLVVYPSVSFGFALNIQALTTTGGRIETAKSNINIARLEVDQEKLRIRAEVLQRYKKYLFSKELVKLKIQVEEESKTNYNYIVQLFQSGEAQPQDQTSAFTSYYNAVEQRLNAQMEVEINRILVEEIIGLTLEEARRYVEDRD